MSDLFQDIFADVETANRFREAFPDLAAKYDTVAADARNAIAKTIVSVDETITTLASYKVSLQAWDLTIKRSQELVDEVRAIVREA